MLSSPSSSDTALLNAYLESDGSQAVINIILAGRALDIDDALLCGLMQSFDFYEKDCPNNCQALRERTIKPFLDAYARLPQNVKVDIKREFLHHLLEEDSVTNRFNQFLSLFQTYTDTFAVHQQTDQMLNIVRKKIREKIHGSDLLNAQNYLTSHLTHIPQVTMKLDYLQKLCAHLNKATQQPDILALFFLEPFILSSELLAKIKMPEDARLSGILKNEMAQKWIELKAALIANPPNWGEGTWQAAKETYQKLETLGESSSADYQALLQRAQDILAQENKELYDLERKRNLIFRHDLKVIENFAPYLAALKTHCQWRDDFSGSEAKQNIQKQIQILEAFKAALKENKEESFLAFLQKRTPVLPQPIENKPEAVESVPVAPVQATAKVGEEIKQKPLSLKARFRAYAPFILTGLAAFALSFYSTPLMLAMLVVGTAVGIKLQYRAKAPIFPATPSTVCETRVPVATPSAGTQLPIPAPTFLVHPSVVPANPEGVAREQRVHAALARQKPKA